MEKKNASKKENHAEKIISLMKKYGGDFSEEEKKNILTAVVNYVLDDNYPAIDSPEYSPMADDADAVS